jgi:uncharacterized protein
MIFSHLPEKIAVFPLSGAIFFPNTILPLNIFEKRYVQLINDCMKGQRLFGMVQPKLKSNNKPNVYDVGCLGKIINFSETEDKRFLISLSGVIRFRIKEEITTDKLYREFKVDYSEFVGDLTISSNKEKKLNIKNLVKKIKIFFKKKNYLIEFNELEKMNVDQLLSTVSMISPFSFGEKQKLIETVKIEDKIIVLEEILNFNLVDSLENNTIQ